MFNKVNLSGQDARNAYFEKMSMTRPWHRFYPTGIPTTLDYPRQPLHHFLHQSARRFPDRTAIIEFDGETGRQLSTKSYRALDEESDRLAAALLDLGVGKGDRVAYFLPNSPALAVGFYGILKAGAVAVPCSPMYRAEELACQLGDCGARTMVCDPDLYPLARQVLPRTHIQTIITPAMPPMWNRGRAATNTSAPSL